MLLALAGCVQPDAEEATPSGAAEVAELGAAGAGESSPPAADGEVGSTGPESSEATGDEPATAEPVVAELPPAPGGGDGRSAGSRSGDQQEAGELELRSLFQGLDPFAHSPDCDFGDPFATCQ